MNKVHNVIIIWSGPAWHSAAIYTWRALLEPLMFEWWMAWWVAAGGQLTTTTEVENYPWFADGIDGTALMMQMRQQSINSGCEIKTQTVDWVKLSDDPLVTPHEVYVWKDTYLTKTVIITTGATAKRLWLPWEETYRQNGISACAVCDGALPIFRNKQLVVIWWGDSACEEASFLTKFGSKVIMLVRKDHFRASKVMQERCFQLEKEGKMEILFNREGREVLWNGDLMTGMKIWNNKTEEETELEASGLFYAIWHIPNTGFLDGQLKLDDANYLIVKRWTTKVFKTWNSDWNLVAWVFAWWDVQDRVYRQAITSAGTWCMAALDAEHFLAWHI